MAVAERECLGPSRQFDGIAELASDRFVDRGAIRIGFAIAVEPCDQDRDFSPRRPTHEILCAPTPKPIEKGVVCPAEKFFGDLPRECAQSALDHAQSSVRVAKPL